MIVDTNFKIENDDYTDVRVTSHELRYVDDDGKLVMRGVFVLDLDVLVGSLWHNVAYAFSSDTYEMSNISRLYSKICDHLFKDSEVVHNGKK